MLGNYLLQTTSADAIFRMHFFLALWGLKLQKVLFAYWVIFFCFCSRLLTFSKIKFFKTFSQEHYQSAKQFGSRPGPTFCWFWSESKGYQQMTKVAASNERIKPHSLDDTSSLSAATCEVFRKYYIYAKTDIEHISQKCFIYSQTCVKQPLKIR